MSSKEWIAQKAAGEAGHDISAGDVGRANLPPVGSVWLGEDSEVRVVHGNLYPFVSYECTKAVWRVTISHTEWREWQATAACIHDPAAPQPDLAAECERLRGVAEILRAAVKYDIRDELIWNDDLQFAVICSDTFAWGMADAEELPRDRLGELIAAMEDGGDIYGTALYCARHRGKRPMQAFYNEQKLSPEMTALFDACGPPSTPPQGESQ